MTQVHYTYITRSPDGRYYIGVRSCEGDPAQDPYMGSHTDETYIPNKKRILATFDSREEALAHEIYLHEVRDVARNPRYANLARQTSTKFYCPGPKSGPDNPFYGRTHSEEFKRAHSERMKERMRGEGNPFYGKTHTAETIERVRQKNLGKTLSKEHREAITRYLHERWSDPTNRQRLSEKMRGRVGPMRGKSHSEESRRRMSEERKGKKWFHDPETKRNVFRRPDDCPPGYVPGRALSEEQRKRLTERMLGTQASEESKLKRSLALKGRSKSKEHAARIGDALRGESKSKEHARKTADAQRGFKWFHHPETGKRTRCLPENCPSGYVPGRGKTVLTVNVD